MHQLLAHGHSLAQHDAPSKKGKNLLVAKRRKRGLGDLSPRIGVAKSVLIFPVLIFVVVIFASCNFYSDGTLAP